MFRRRRRRRCRRSHGGYASAAGRGRERETPVMTAAAAKGGPRGLGRPKLRLFSFPNLASSAFSHPSKSTRIMIYKVHLLIYIYDEFGVLGLVLSKGWRHKNVVPCVSDVYGLREQKPLSIIRWTRHRQSKAASEQNVFRPFALLVVSDCQKRQPGHTSPKW